MNGQEKYPKSEQNRERGSESYEDILETYPKEQESLNRKNVEAQNNNQEESHKDALEKASELAEKSEKIKKEDSKKSPEKRIFKGAPSKKQLNQSFDNQMDSVQRELPLPQRVLSKLIHAKTIEKTTELLEKTIARPNALLSGSIAAFLAVSTSYFVAKYFGYQLSGFEAIGAFIIGWIIGLTYDWLSSVLGKGNR